MCNIRHIYILLNGRWEWYWLLWVRWEMEYRPVGIWIYLSCTICFQFDSEAFWGVENEMEYLQMPPKGLNGHSLRGKHAQEMIFWQMMTSTCYSIHNHHGISQRQQLGNLALSGHLDWYNFRGHEISWMTPNDWINRRFFEHWSQFFQAVFAFCLPNGFAKRVVAEQTAVTISHQSEQTTGCRDFCAPWEKDSPQPGLPASRNREGAREVAWTKAFADEFAPVENPRYPADSLTHPTHQLVEWSGLYLACWSEHKSLTQLHFFLEKKEFRHLFKF